jgi:hypothetical protein
MDAIIVGAIAGGLAVPLLLSVLRRAGREIVVPDNAASARDPRAELRERGWSFRELTVTVDGRAYRVNYEAAGVGESVLVDGVKVASGAGALSLVPRFEFELAGRRGLIEIDVAWFVAIKGFRLSLDDAVLYAEGTRSTTAGRSLTPRRSSSPARHD